MRSPPEIRSRLEREEQKHNRELLAWSLYWDLEKLAERLPEAYEDAFISALRHRPNTELVDKFATLTWLAGSDLIVTDHPWLQYGMPRIRIMAKELKLPFPYLEISNSSITYLKAKRMSNGLPCTESCVRCFHGNIR